MQPSPSDVHASPPRPRVDLPPLTFNEQLRVRHAMQHLSTENIDTAFALRAVLAELGVYPNDDEVVELLDVVEQKLSFNALCHYLSLLKRRHQVQPVPGEDDALRAAFIALAGGPNERLSVQRVEQLCAAFKVTFDRSAVPRGCRGMLDCEAFGQLLLGSRASHASRGGSDASESGEAMGILPHHRVASVGAPTDLTLTRILPDLIPSTRAPVKPPTASSLARRRSRPDAPSSIPFASRSEARALRKSLAPLPLPLPTPSIAAAIASAPVTGGYKAPSPIIVGLSPRHRAYRSLRSGRRPAPFS